MNQDPIQQPKLIDVEPSIHLLGVVTGRCSRCCTQMPIHALRIITSYIGNHTTSRCINEVACADRERKMFARQDDIAKRWAIGAQGAA